MKKRTLFPLMLMAVLVGVFFTASPVQAAPVQAICYDKNQKVIPCTPVPNKRPRKTKTPVYVFIPSKTPSPTETFTATSAATPKPTSTSLPPTKTFTPTSSATVTAVLIPLTGNNNISGGINPNPVPNPAPNPAPGPFSLSPLGVGSLVGILIGLLVAGRLLPAVFRNRKGDLLPAVNKHQMSGST